MKRFTLLFCAIALLFGSVNAKDKNESLQNKVDNEYSNSLINRLDAAFNSQPKDIRHGNDATSLFVEADKNWSKLSQSAKDKVEELQGDFDDLDLTEVSKDKYFRYWYTDTGDNAIDMTDDDDNGIPDVIDFYDESFTLAKKNYIAAGYSLPATNGSYYEVYLSNTACRKSVYGFTRVTSVIGNNPNSPEVESYSCKSYIAIRTDFSGFSTGYEWSVKITSAHEFFHAIQMGYDYETLRSMYVMEGCAVWSEEWNYTNSFDAFQYLDQHFSVCDMQLNYAPTDTDDPFYTLPYGNWVFFRYITDLYGPEFIKKLYVNHINSTQENAFEKTLSSYGTNYKSLLQNYFVSQYIMSKVETEKPIYWSLADTMSKRFSARYEKTFVLNEGTTINYNSATTGNKRFQKMSADYYKINYNSGVSITIQAQDANDTMAIYLIQSDLDKNPTKIKYDSAMVYGTTPVTVELKNNVDMRKLNLVICNLKIFAEDGVSSFYNLTVNPDVLGVEDNINEPFTINGINPSPATENSTLNITTNEFGLYNYTIYNIAGKEMLNGAFYSNGINNSVPMNLLGLNSGVYLIQVTNGKETKSINFVVQ